MNRAEYEKIDATNYSLLKHMGRSPHHYRYACENDTQPDTDAMALGRVVHLAVFEPGKLDSHVAIWEGRRAGKEWEAFSAAASAAGQDVIKPGPYEHAMAMAKAARSAAGKLLSEGESEVTLQWRDAETGVDMKGRLDHLSRGHGIIDLKTCNDARPLVFGSRAASLSYHVQAALYVDGAMQCGHGLLPYTLLAVESRPPYAATTYTVPLDTLQLGQDTYREWLAKLVECRKTDTWPSYPPGVLAMPRWATYEPEDEDTSNLIFEE